MEWFNVDKAGLAKLMDGRSKAFILYELIQNAWDEASKNVSVSILRDPGSHFVTIRVQDDNPEGFKDISHAYTLFAESDKKADAEKRGRFNMGEKLVLALARTAYIETTKGTIDFNATGRHESKHKRDSGSVVCIEIKATIAEQDEMIDAASRLIPPPGIRTVVNGEEIAARTRFNWFEVELPTIFADSEGVLRPTKRKTLVRLHHTLPGETAMLYEMGIPVVETGDKYHVDVQQKVPLNMDRDNVTPAYLRAIRVAVLNHTAEQLAGSDVTETWVREACSDPKAESEAVKRVIGLRFGENAVTFDPSDREANKISLSEDRQVVHGAHLTAGEWSNVRKIDGLLLPAGKVTPSPKPYSPDGDPLTLIKPEDWTPGMNRIVEFARVAAKELMHATIRVQIANDPTWGTAATYGPGKLLFNAGRLGFNWFDEGISEEVIDLIIHEFGHHYEMDHLSRGYYDALTKLGARMTRLALLKPELFV